MRQSDKYALWFIDLAGVVSLAALLALLVWFVTVRYDTNSTELTKLHAAVKSAQGDIRSLSQSQRQQDTLVAERQEKLTNLGKIPTSAPISGYFRTVSGLATSAGLDVLGQTPMSPQGYPGLIEERCAYEVAGTLPKLARFLHKIEQTEYWADVGYLSIERKNQIGVASAGCMAKITFSLFASPAMDHASSKVEGS